VAKLARTHRDEEAAGDRLLDVGLLRQEKHRPAEVERRADELVARGRHHRPAAGAIRDGDAPRSAAAHTEPCLYEPGILDALSVAACRGSRRPSGAAITMLVSGLVNIWFARAGHRRWQPDGHAQSAA
jgi:hypothetical protein